MDGPISETDNKVMVNQFTALNTIIYSKWMLLWLLQREYVKELIDLEHTGAVHKWKKNLLTRLANHITYN